MNNREWKRLRKAENKLFQDRLEKRQRTAKKLRDQMWKKTPEGRVVFGDNGPERACDPERFFRLRYIAQNLEDAKHSVYRAASGVRGNSRKMAKFMKEEDGFFDPVENEDWA